VVRVDVDAEPNLLKSNVGTIERVAGTGVSALSDGAITTALGSDGWYRLANITVSNGDTSIVTGDIADTRTKVATNDAITIRDNYTAQVIPAGMISPYAGAAAPSGFLLCDGSAVSRTTYANLFTAISDAFGGGDGSTTFNIPNLVRRFPLGKDTTSKVVVDDCEDTWNESTAANVTSEVDASDFKVGSNSVKLTVGSAVTAGTILATEVISSVNLRPYSSIYVWVKSSVTASAGDLQLLLDDTANCASPVYTLNMPALVANVWKRVKLDLTHPTNDVSMVSIGVKMVNDLGSFVLRLDDVSIGNGFEVGIAGGEEYHILKIAELAAHTHSAKVDPTSGGGGGSSSAPQNGQSGSTGGDQGHNTMPPFLTINYIIKT
jgi:microcystin-dependent protein